MTGNITDPTGSSSSGENIKNPVSQCNQYSHQLRLLPIINNVSVAKIPYVFIIKDQAKESDNTNTEGKTKRIHTKGAEKVDVLVGKLASGYLKRKNSFGSLKSIDERKIKLITEVSDPLYDHPYTKGYDYIVVSAARTAPWDVSLGGATRWFTESKGNQYRFVNCSLRQLRFFPDASKHDHAVQKIHVVFQQGYTQTDINRINEYTKNLHARVVYVKNVNELIAFLNQRKEKQRLIKQLVIFCHGIFNHASFHYQGKNVEAGLFGLADIPKVQEPLFDYDALITTYACRAGISVDGKDLTGQNAGQAHSQAQKMADNWDVNVKAFEMRSSYDKVYGTGSEIKTAQNYKPIMDNYDKELEVYNQKKAAGDKEAKPPPKPKDYDENVLRYYDLRDREQNGKGDDGPIAPNGAWCFPGTGDTPKGLKEGLQAYKPKEWQT